MRNSFESFEQYQHRENLEVNAERTKNISHEILENQECRNYLQTKIQQKIDFKRSVSYDDGSNEFSPWKRLGMFIVHEQKLPQTLVSILQRNGVDIYGDEVLELHIPPQDASIADVKKSFDRVREYLNVNQRDRHIPRFIYGVSYLARLAKHWGFTVVDLPDDIQEKSGAANVLRSYASAETDPKKQKIAEKFTTKDIKLCYMPVEKLLQGKN